MNFGNQAHERAEEAESHVRCLEDETSKLWEELQSFMQLSEGECTENFLIDTLISSLISTEEVASASHSFLEANNGVDVCEKMLEIWDGLLHCTSHGTYIKEFKSIMESGLKRKQRLRVHFACGLPTDGDVISGMRRDVNMLIFLDIKKALEGAMKYISDNKVILTEGFDGVVPVE